MNLNPFLLLRSKTVLRSTLSRRSLPDLRSVKLTWTDNWRRSVAKRLPPLSTIFICPPYQYFFRQEYLNSPLCQDWFLHYKIRIQNAGSNRMDSNLLGLLYRNRLIPAGPEQKDGAQGAGKIVIKSTWLLSPWILIRPPKAGKPQTGLYAFQAGFLQLIRRRPKKGNYLATNRAIHIVRGE